MTVFDKNIDWVDEFIEEVYSNWRINFQDELKPTLDWSHAPKYIQDNFTCVDGATKFVFIHNDHKDWVIKCDKWIFNVSRSGVEALIWEKAKNTNCAEHLAETYLYDGIDGFNFFIQRYAEVNEDYVEERLDLYIKNQIDSDSYKDEDTYNDLFWELREDMETEDYINAMIENEDIANDLIALMNKFGLGDFHEGNWGKVDGRWVIIDYSGYLNTSKYRQKGLDC